MAAENNDIIMFKEVEDSTFFKGKTLFLRKKFEEISKQHANQLYNISKNKYNKSRNSDSYLLLRRHSDKEDIYENVITKPKLLSYIAKGNRPTSINEFIALRNKFELSFNENLKLKQTDESVLLQSNSSRNYNHNDDVREKFAVDHENKYNLIGNSHPIESTEDSDEDGVTLRHLSTVTKIYNYNNIEYGGRPFSYRSQSDLATTKDDTNAKIEQDLEEIAKKKIVKNVIQKINSYRSKQSQTQVKKLINSFESIGSENI